jgi:DNA-binding helix-hairpin-helix protein with protein kinase domain
MPSELVTEHGQPIALGRELGRGGEGAVFEVAGRPDCVAKVYHQAPSQYRQEKLRAMVASIDDELLSYTTWPQETLHAPLSRLMLGYLTRRICGAQPVHALYGPGQRKRDFPSAGFDFLVHAARNTAAAFASLHAHGHAVGDVNQGNVVIRSDSRALLIDCDSFQIAGAGGPIHRCEVGVSHFSPPELQAVSRFDATVRSANHDNFGLALLVFHLLFAGRHPFSGVMTTREEISLEQAIAKFKFAYSRSAAARGVRLPPNALDLSLVTEPLAGMFEQAFTEAGTADHGRPTASQWVEELDVLRYSLTRCSDQPVHVYPQHLRACPWCHLDAKGVVLFLARGCVITSDTRFDLSEMWSAIEGVRLPPAGPSPGTYKAVRPSEAAIAIGRLNRDENLLRWAGIGLVIVLLIALIAIAPPLALPILPIGAYVVIRNKQRDVDIPEGFREALAAATTSKRAQTARWGREPATLAFEARQRTLSDARNAYRALIQEREARAQSFRAAARVDFDDSLKHILIDEAVIDGISAVHKYLLAKRGIKTAADVQQDTATAALGSATLADALMRWRKEVQGSVQPYRSSAALVDDDPVAASRCAARLAALEHELSQGADQLKHLADLALAQRANLRKNLEAATAAVAQAEADLNAAGGRVAWRER